MKVYLALQEEDLLCKVDAMTQAGELRVSARGQMNLPAAARKRWGIDDEGGHVGYLDLGDAIVIIPGGVAALRADMLAAVGPEVWTEANEGFGDPELATQ